MSWLKSVTRRLSTPVTPATSYHDAPDLEATLPSTVAARQMVRWSVARDNFWDVLGGNRARSELTPELESVGAAPSDIEMAVAGRADSAHDPPYIVWALQFGSLTGSDLWGPVPSSIAMDVMHVNVNRGENWRDATLGGKKVLIGNRSMIDQNRHQHGMPYVWITKSAIYALITDDESWAEEVVKGHDSRGGSPALRG